MRESLFEVRLRYIQRFYELLDRLEAGLGGKRTLGDSHGGMLWPQRGVYFFFEPGEERTTSGSGLRVVRVGTHALRGGSTTTLWHRLRQHRGTVGGSRPGGGNQRSSVFRRHVGTALIAKDGWPEPVSRHWGRGSSPSKGVRQAEYPLECAVSQHIRCMPFLWLAVDDEPGLDSLRGSITTDHKHQTGVIDALYSPAGTWTVVELVTDPVKALDGLMGLLACEDNLTQAEDNVRALESLLGDTPSPVLCMLDYGGSVLAANPWNL